MRSLNMIAPSRGHSLTRKFALFCLPGAYRSFEAQTQMPIKSLILLVGAQGFEPWTR